MAQPASTAQEAARGRLTRRMALRAGAIAGAAGAGLGMASRGVGSAPAPAATRASGALHLEFDTVGVNFLTFSRDGGVKPAGTPMEQGDHCNMAWRLHAVGQADGEQIGDWHCLGPQIGSTREPGALGPAFLITAQFELYGRGKLSGVSYCGGPIWNEGTITGGTGEFFGARGSFRFGPRAEGGTLGDLVGLTFDVLLAEPV